MSKKFVFNSLPLAEALGLSTKGLMSFTLVAKPECYPVIEATYLVGWEEKENGDVEPLTTLKKYHLVKEED